MIHLAPETPRCPRDLLNDAIVVCARDESPRYRISSTLEDNPGSDAARKTGQLVPPDVSGLPKCGVCIRGGWAPPPVYYVDVIVSVRRRAPQCSTTRKRGTFH